MRIDSTRFTKFLANPERYRLSQLWNLAPIMPKPGTMARMFMRGRMRGSAFHEILEDKTPDPLIYTPEEISAAEEMADLVRTQYSEEKVICIEREFEYRTYDHVAVGRIDRIVESKEGSLIVDFKTCGKCTKKELAERIASYVASAQPRFYSLGSGYSDFEYRIVQRDKIIPVRFSLGALELKKFSRHISMICSTIEHWTKAYGIEQPWPQLHERYTTGFEPLLGKRMYDGYMPEGFEKRNEHLSIIEERTEVPDL